MARRALSAKRTPELSADAPNQDQLLAHSGSVLDNRVQGLGQMPGVAAGNAVLDLGAATEPVREYEGLGGGFAYGGEEDAFGAGHGDVIVAALEASRTSRCHAAEVSTPWTRPTQAASAYVQPTPAASPAWTRTTTAVVSDQARVPSASATSVGTR
jgi:hypothetical protein